MLLYVIRVERIGKLVFGVKGVFFLLRVIKVLDKVLLYYMYFIFAGEFLRRLNIWLNL